MVHQCSSPTSVEAAIGAGVGPPLTLGLAAAVVSLLRERHMQRRDAKDAHQYSWSSPRTILTQRLMAVQL